MRYLGGKSRLGKKIAQVILKATARRKEYVEPFLGGAGAFVHLAPHFDTVRASDVHEDLILMWQAIQQGWAPPTHVSEEEYKALRHAEPSALRGFAGFCCSFGGKWFNGYARCGSDAKPGKDPRSYAANGSRALAKAAPSFASAIVERTSFDTMSPSLYAVVYCDPPYRGTTEYSNAFDSDRFFAVVEQWSRNGSDVFVSEYQAPSGWVSIWEQEHNNSVAIGKAKKTTERLFVHESRVPFLTL